MSLPRLLTEDSVNPFKYYWEGEIRLGMTIGGRLYALLETFSEEERAIAYEKGCQLANDHDVLLTVSREMRPRYRLWIALASGTNRVLLSQAGKSLDSKTTAGCAS